MKYLKLILFSLMAIAMITVFFSSCQKDTTLPSDQMQQIEISASVQNYIKKKGEIIFYLPPDLKDADEETVQGYLADMTIGQIEEREESYRIENYLASIDRLYKVYNDIGEYDLLTKSDLGKFTSEQEHADFNSFEVNSEIESRWCMTLWSTCFYPYRYTKKLCCKWWRCYTKITVKWC